MKTINLNISINTKSLLILTTLLLGSYFTFNAKNTLAQSNTTPSGSCAIILNTNLAGWNNSLDNKDVSQSSLGIVNFDTSTFYGIDNTATNYNHSNVAIKQNKGSMHFTLKPGPFSGTYYLLEDGAYSSVFLVAVNNGNSYLAMVLNSDKPSKTGVCQKI